MCDRVKELINLEVKKDYLYVKYLLPEYSIDEAKIIIDHRKEVTNNTPYFILADLSHIKKSSKEVRNYFANEGSENVLGSAFFFEKKFPSILFNFFIFLSHPKIEIKVFDDYNKAKDWLLDQISTYRTTESKKCDH